MSVWRTQAKQSEQQKYRWKMRHEQDLRDIEHESSRRNIYFKLIMENDGYRRECT